MITRGAVHGTGRMAAAIVAAAESLEGFRIIALAGPQPPAGRGRTMCADRRLVEQNTSEEGRRAMERRGR